MIYDKIENVKKYLGISPNLDKALNFIMRTDLNSLPEDKAGNGKATVYYAVAVVLDAELAFCYSIY